MLYQFFICFVAGIGAGLGTDFAGMSAAAVISPMLITFLDVPAYSAVGIALASDVLASAVSAYTYGRNQNLDVKNGVIMMATVLCFTLVGSWISSLVPGHRHGWVFRLYDAASGDQVHRASRYDHQGEDGDGQWGKAGSPVHSVRDAGRLHLRLCRGGRRYDDAADPHQRAGL